MRSGVPGNRNRHILGEQSYIEGTFNTLRVMSRTSPSKATVTRLTACLGPCVVNPSGFPTLAVDSVDPGVHRGHHRLPPGGVFRLLGQTPGPGPEGAGAPEGVRHPPDGHLRHRLPHQLRGDHGPQRPLRARGHLDHQLR